MNKDYYYYYEVLDYKSNTKKYISAYAGVAQRLRHFDLLYRAERVWLEDSTGVSIIKNRSSGSLQDVDMKEFFWIKLRSVPYAV